MNKLAVAALVLACVCMNAFAEGPAYRPASSTAYKWVRSAKAEFEVPIGWRVATAQDLQAATLERASGRYEAVASNQRGGTGAVVVALAHTPGRWPKSTLAEVTEQRLVELGTRMGREYRGKTSPSGLGTLQTDPTYQVLDLTVGDAQVRALMMSYVEEGPDPEESQQPVRWKTRHLVIPRQGYELELMMAYYERDEAQWWPVMRHVMATLEY